MSGGKRSRQVAGTTLVTYNNGVTPVAEIAIVAPAASPGTLKGKNNTGTRPPFFFRSWPARVKVQRDESSFARVSPVNQVNRLDLFKCTNRFDSAVSQLSPFLLPLSLSLRARERTHRETIKPLTTRNSQSRYPGSRPRCLG